MNDKKIYECCLIVYENINSTIKGHNSKVDIFEYLDKFNMSLYGFKLMLSEKHNITIPKNNDDEELVFFNNMIRRYKIKLLLNNC